MAVRKFKPTTPGQRHKVIGVFDDITKRTPEKALTVGKRGTGGRNNEGHLTMRYIGGGHKRRLRLIDFKRNKDGVPATVKAIEYDPNRSARIALLYYADGYKAYIIAPNGLTVGCYGGKRRERSPRSGKRASVEQDSCRNAHPQHRAPSWTGCRHGTRRRYLCAADFARGRLRYHQITLG